ncbi:hypothetical protein FHT32_000211 [Variovorax sp. SG517]|uniref:hypothetical protein n=1 Tax=Variovorax sp. SG517 TaxID=2587117 RepID=UPI00159E5E47|nr:hypothetical protein [Variovorax sp. SG517]NVM86588.1 hypothetical protein [Variovorax sp. SG517]
MKLDLQTIFVLNELSSSGFSYLPAVLQQGPGAFRFRRRRAEALQFRELRQSLFLSPN